LRKWNIVFTPFVLLVVAILLAGCSSSNFSESEELSIPISVSDIVGTPNERIRMIADLVTRETYGYQYAQFRLRFEEISDADGNPDLMMFFITTSNTNEPGIFELEVTIIPKAGVSVEGK